MRRRVVYKKKSQNRLSMIMAVIVMLVLMAAVGARMMSLKSQLDGYDEKKATLEAQIQEEKDRTGEIEEYGKYTQTDQFVEETAREKLGLVKDDEIIFKNEDAH